jgi:hypothetical protein
MFVMVCGACVHDAVWFGCMNACGEVFALRARSSTPCVECRMIFAALWFGYPVLVAIKSDVVHRWWSSSTTPPLDLH